MILCRNGHENRDGATVCVVCGVPLGGPAEVEEPVAAKPVPPRVSLAEESLRVAPGGEVGCEVRVENPGEVAGEFGLTVLGEAAAFASVAPGSLSLAAGAGGVATVTFRPPVSAAGAVPFEVRVTSQALPEEPVSAVGLVEVAAAPVVAAGAGLSAELRPPTSKGRLVGVHELLVHNGGSAAAESRPAGAGADGAVEVAVDPAALTIAPGESAVARVRVTPRRPLWLGKERTLPFRLRVAPDVAVDGAMVQQARLPLRLALPLAAAAVAVAVIVPIVSSGSSGGSQPTVPVPNVIGLDEPTALDVLHNVGLDGEIKRRFSVTPPFGQVVGTDPAVGTVIPTDQKVLLFVRLRLTFTLPTATLAPPIAPGP